MQTPKIDPAQINRQTKLDLLAINFPVFFVNDPAVYTKVNQAFLSTSSNPAAQLPHKFGEFLSVYLKGMDAWERELALNVNGSIIATPLSEAYWSMMAFRLGALTDPNRTAIKFKFEPCKSNYPAGGNPAWTQSRDFAKPLNIWKSGIPRKTLETLQKPENRYYLRNVLYSALTEEKSSGACFDLQVQRFIDRESTPVEDTTGIWLESKEQQKAWADKFSKNAGAVHLIEKAKRKREIMARKISEPVTIGRIELLPVPAQEANAVLAGESANEFECDSLSFNPWNNVASEHKPLGIVGRMRRAAYSASSHTRRALNQVK
jgi:hypothetical protein